MRTKPWPAITLLICAPILMNLAFTGLGVSFDYPGVLQSPAADVLARFRAHQSTVVALFTPLAVAACAFGPLAVLVGRFDDSATMRWAVRAGIAAAVVQAVGLLRWPLLVPGLAADGTPESLDTFATLNTVLGTLVGETLGYALTAAWTALVVTALRDRVPGWFAWLGYVSAAAMAVGVLAPIAEQAGLVNFVGYLLWSCWLLAFAVLLARQGVMPRRVASQGS